MINSIIYALCEYAFCEFVNNEQAVEKLFTFFDVIPVQTGIQILQWFAGCPLMRTWRDSLE